MKNSTVVLKTSKFDFLRSQVTLCCINKGRKILPSAIRINHFLDTRAIKIEARNYVVVTS